VALTCRNFLTAPSGPGAVVKHLGATHIAWRPQSVRSSPDGGAWHASNHCVSRAGARPAGRAAGRKSPLRVVNELPPFTFDDEPGVESAAARTEVESAPELTAAQLRRLMISEFRDWLRSRTNRNGRPFQADTISAYADAAIALDAWISAEGIEADFTACDTKALDRFSAGYFTAHGQGGTNTKRRNLRHLFSWLERENDHRGTPRPGPGRPRWPGSSSPTCWR
jgi:hypothetical protein